jgi:hypothetical protein
MSWSKIALSPDGLGNYLQESEMARSKMVFI